LSEVRKTHTNTSALARVIVIVLSGARVLLDHTNRICGVAATVYQRERGPHRFSRKLDSEDCEDVREEAESGAPLPCGEGLRLSTELLDRVLSCRVGFPLRMGTNENYLEPCAVLDTLVKIPTCP
jgi:hypothetical protein